MRARQSYPVRRDGEWFRIERGGHLFACCDCGLVHKLRSRLRGRSIEVSATRMPQNTGGVRRAMRIRLIKQGG